MEPFESTSIVATDKVSNISSWTSIEGDLEGFKEEDAPDVRPPNIQHRRVQLEQI